MPDTLPPSTDTSVPWPWIPRVGLLAGPVAALLVYSLLPSGAAGLDHPSRATAAVGIWMAIWWMTEAIAIEATSLLPIILLPLLGIYSDKIRVGDEVTVKSTGAVAQVLSIEKETLRLAFAIPDGDPVERTLPRKQLSKESAVQRAATPYADRSIFLFMGGFMIATALERWGLHRRVAMLVLLSVGTAPRRLVAGFMLATAGISLWISNTATTVMMLPIALSVIQVSLASVTLTKSDSSTSSALGKCLLLGVAYAASIGGVGTLVGTPPNVFFAGFVREKGIELGFAQWMLFACPFAMVYLAIGWATLVYWLFPLGNQSTSGSKQVLEEEWRKLGPMSRGEWQVLTVFLVISLLWITREQIVKWQLLVDWVPSIQSLDDAWIAMAGAVVLFLWPVNLASWEFTLDWRTASKLPWGVLLLFGGGLSLAVAMNDTGLANWIGQQVTVLRVLPTWLLMVVLVAAVILFSELASNIATATAVLPLLYQVAIGLEIDPMLLLVPAALAASCGFMLPVATPPNAIVFGSGHLKVSDMVRAGLVLDLVAVALIPLFTFWWGKWTLGIGQ